MEAYLCWMGRISRLYIWQDRYKGQSIDTPQSSGLASHEHSTIRVAEAIAEAAHFTQTNYLIASEPVGTGASLAT